MLDGTAGDDRSAAAPALGWYARCFPHPAWVPPLVLTLLCVAVMYNNWVWLQASGLRVNFDLPVHATRALEMLYAWNSGELYRVITQPDHGHGPAGYLVGMLGLQLLGVRLENLLFATSLLVPVYALAIYQIGKDLYGPSAGFWSAVYGLSIPLFVDVSKQYPLEMSSQTFTLLALMLLFKSDGLRRPFHTIGFGLFVGLAVLTKNEMAAVWAAPMVVLALAVVSRLHVGGQGRAAHIGAGLLRLTVLTTFIMGSVALVRLYPTHRAAWNQHLQADVSAWLRMSLIVVLAALGCAWGSARSLPRPAARLIGLTAALSVTALLLLPRMLAIDVEGLMQERISSSVMGAQFVDPYLDPVKSARLFVSRAWHYLYTALLALGIVAFFAGGDHRDRRRLFLFGFFAWVATLLAIIPSKFEYYQMNLVGLTAILAVAPLLRVRRLAAPLVAVLGLWGGAQIFGWMAVPSTVDKESLYPFQTYDVIELANHRFTPSLYPLLAEPPLSHRPLMPDVLQAATDDAKGPFLIAVLPTPTTFTFYHHDTFRMVALYGGFPATVVANREHFFGVATEQAVLADEAVAANALDARVQRVLAQVPLYFVAQGEMSASLEARAPQYLDALLQTRAHVRLRLLRRFETSQTWRLLLYRVNPDIATGGRPSRR